MRGGVRVGLGLVAWAALVVAGCTTGFELQTRPADVPTDRGVASDQGLDGGVSADGAADAAPVDAPAPVCREPGDRCCADAMRGAFCTAGLVCSEGYCARCPGALFACGNACVDLQTSARHCGACGAACVDGQRCVGGSCVADCAASATVCGNRCVNVQDDPQHCGGCDRACVASGANTASRCRAGTCQVSCQAGFDDCDGSVASGCETDTRTSSAHCGACGQACAPPRATGRCEAGACSVRECAAGYGDCDGNVTNGCEVDHNRDPVHCGTCDNLCDPGEVCRGGACVLTSTPCDPGWADCSTGPIQCETDVRTDLANCGACGRTCAFANAAATCAGGACSLGGCAAGYLDCDGMASNGCERRVANDGMHCGACGRVCAAPNGTPSCRAGACTIDACDEGFLDCDGLVANGCEVDSRTSAAHCGACGSACSAQGGTSVCNGGRCEIRSCLPGAADCDGRASNGCEVDLTADPLNCGRCGDLCAFPNAASSCVGGGCGLGACAAGYANCDGVAGNGCETDTRVSASHCGACGQACSFANASATCAGGVCALGACASNYANCDGNVANGCETDTRSSGAHCGGCGRACATGNICSNAACVLSCPPGQTVCAGACVDLNSNVSHCRACGNVCSAGANQTAGCSGGTCTRRCADDYGDCDGNVTNGCETDLRTDGAHCGGCRASCESPPNAAGYCENRACQFLCQRAYGDCDGSSANGCEAAFQTDPSHCGGCGEVCPSAGMPRLNIAASTCADGRCAITCRDGWADCDGVLSNGCEQSLYDIESCGRCANVCPVVTGGTAVCCRSDRTAAPVCCIRTLGQVTCLNGGIVSDTTCR